MNNSKTPKIVVGVGLVAAYAAGLTFLTLRDAPDSAIVPSGPSAVSAQMVAAPASAPSAIPESADTLASADALAPESIAPAAAPAPVAPVITNAAKAPEAARPAVVSQPKPRVEEVPVASLPSPRPQVIDAEELSRSNTGSNAVSELAATEERGASESVTAAEDTSPDDEGESSAEVPASIIGN